ncbi:hypothetical protein ACC689_35040, partial [Rhizobium ruizarguesonis]
RHFLAQFGPCLAWPLTKLTDVVDLDDALIENIGQQSDEQAADLSIRELERILGIAENLQVAVCGHMAVIVDPGRADFLLDEPQRLRRVERR